MNLIVKNEKNVNLILKENWFGLNYPKDINGPGWRFFEIDKQNKLDYITTRSCFDFDSNNWFKFPTLVCVTKEQFNNWESKKLIALNCWIYTL